MKKITLLFLLLFASFGYSQTLPIDFEESDDSNIFASVGDGGTFNIIADADTSGEFVGEFSGKVGGAAYDHINVPLTTSLDIAATNTISFRVKQTSTEGTANHLFKLQQGTGGTGSPKEVAFTTELNVWKDITLTYSGTGTYNELIIFFDFASTSVSGTYLIDDIVASSGTPADTYDLPFDFETSPVTSDWEGFEGALITVEAVAAPQTTGNSSTNLAKIIRNGGQTYAGVVTAVDTPLDFSTKSTITARIWTSAPIGTKIMFKTEEAGNAGNNSGEKNAFTTKTGEWEDLVFDFAGVTNASQTRIVIIPDNGNLGDGSATSTFYFDDIIQTAAGGNNTAECAGTSSEAQQGSFSADYSYGFETLTNGNVRLTFAMPSGTAGLVAYAWKQTPFAETRMTVSGTVATLDIAGYSNGESISYAVKFAWAAGGFGVTKYFTYIVGNDCATASIDKNNLLEISLYPNPASNRLNISAANTIQNAEIYNVLGKKVMNVTINKTSESIDISNLASGVYMIKYNIENSIGTAKFIKQ